MSKTVHVMLDSEQQHKLRLISQTFPMKSLILPLVLSLSLSHTCADTGGLVTISTESKTKQNVTDRENTRNRTECHHRDLDVAMEL